MNYITIMAIVCAYLFLSCDIKRLEKTIKGNNTKKYRDFKEFLN